MSAPALLRVALVSALGFSALVAGVAMSSSASAVPASSVAASSPRVQGPFNLVYTYTSTGSYALSYASGGSGRPLAQVSVTAGTTPSRPGEVFTYPQLGTSGPISPAANPSLCFTASNTGSASTLSPCGVFNAATQTQTFRFDSRGYINMVGAGGYVISYNLNPVLGQYSGNVNTSAATMNLAALTLVPQEVAKLTAEVTAIDGESMSVVVGGTGEPGATITVTGLGDPVTTVVDAAGSWSAKVPGLSEGQNDMMATQTVGSDTQTAPLTVMIEPLPVINPVVAAVTAIPLGGLALAILRRRRRAR